MTERTEERLRAAMHAEAAEVETADAAAWAAVQQRVRDERRRSRAMRGALVGAAAAVVAVVVAIGALQDGDDTTVDITPAAPSTTTTTTPAVVVAEEPEIAAIWPFTTQAQIDAYVADPGVGMFLDGEATALEFAREYLAMPDPVVAHGFRPAEGFSGYVDIAPRAGSPMVTTVWVHRYGGEDGAYSVYFAETSNIRPAGDAHGVTVGGDFVGVRGTSTAFEAHVDLEVRDANGEVLGRTFVMGGANGDFAPFDGAVQIVPPSTPTGAVVLSTSSAEDGTVQEAMVVPVVFAAEEQSFSVFFHRGEELVEVTRTGPRTAGVLRQALEALVAGPTPEEQAAGLGSLFSAETAAILAGVTVDDGTAIVDFRDGISNASTAAGSEALLEELHATAFQFPTVERVEYRLRGSCEAFWLALQRSGCEVIPRPAN
jgi:hypothetical protein